MKSTISKLKFGLGISIVVRGSKFIRAHVQNCRASIWTPFRHIPSHFGFPENCGQLLLACVLVDHVNIFIKYIGIPSKGEVFVVLLVAP